MWHGCTDYFLVMTLGPYLKLSLSWIIRKVVVDLGPPVVLECCSAVCQRARRRDGDGDCLTEN